MKKMSLLAMLFVVFVLVAGFATPMTAQAENELRSTFDAWLLYGHSVRVDNGGDNKNNFGSGMAEYRPFAQKVDSGYIDYGGYVRAEIGSGESGTKTMSNYDWMKYGFGLNAKYWSNQYWDVNTRLGLRFEHNKAKGTKQDTTAVEAAVNIHSEQGRVAKRKYLTEGDLFLQAVKPLSRDKKSDAGLALTPDAKSSTDAKLQIGIMDIKLDSNNILVPIAGLGTGTTSVGTEEKGKVNYMLGLKWKTKGHDRLTGKVENEHVAGGRVNTTGTITINVEF